MSGTRSNPDSSDSASYSGASTIVNVSPKVPSIPSKGLLVASMEEKCQAFLETSPDPLTSVGPDPSGSVSKKKNKRKRKKERREWDDKKKKSDKRNR